MANVKDLKKAIEIFEAYVDEASDFEYSCQHEQMFIGNSECSPKIMSEEDVQTLDDLSFWWDDEYECWVVFT